MKNYLLVIGIVAIAVLSWIMLKPDAAIDGKPVIYVTSIVEIEPIAQLREGFYKKFKEENKLTEFTFVEKNAQGDNSLVVQIADEIARKEPALVFVLGTPLAQAIQARSPNITIVQGAVTDPIASDLANTWEGSGRKYAATSDKPPIDLLLKLMRDLFPKAMNVGVLFNPSEPNSISIINQIKSSSSLGDLIIREFAVGIATDLPLASSSAVRGSDIIFIPPDNLVTSGLRSVIASADQSDVPVVATTADAVLSGATAAVSTDFVLLGKQSALLAINILIDGADPAVLPIQLPSEMKVYVNSERVEKYGGDLTTIDKSNLVIID